MGIGYLLWKPRAPLETKECENHLLFNLAGEVLKIKATIYLHSLWVQVFKCIMTYSHSSLVMPYFLYSGEGVEAHKG